MRQLRPRTPALIAGILALAIGGGYVAGHRRPAEALSRSHRPGMESALALQQTFADVAGEVEPAVVSVKIEKTVRQMEWRRAPRGRRGPFQYYEAPGAEQSVPIGEGSGVIFRPDGYALTNYHVVQHADTLKVKLHDGRELPAEVVGTDELLDLAVIKINSREKFTAAELGDSDQIAVGQWAIAIGNPFQLGNTFTVGVISAKGRELDSLAGETSFQNYLQTDASINLGNSGGPLVNVYGEVVGINNAIYSPNGANVGIGFAIPINNAKAVLDELVAGKKIVRGYLGVRIGDVTPELAKEVESPNQTTGVVIAAVEPGGPADRGGIQPGDIVVAFDGTPVKDQKQLSREIAKLGTGTARMEVVRKGQHVSLKVALGEFPNEA
ncbi:MAG: hypothetical protein AUJ96_18370 [Armatimonadetes bacterium CG2_30_66_41]|nr:PDZ domain-containing protein [Armatimonadota bacterium]NCO92464.1 PDZ domain-containing protein [Armatimonadota bacterium]NCP31844.1 PDZ domain-containing protein [Armatimonadota bacterium]NDK11506.1 PDZ domain-containing protein [Armatimonadota bacterium]OIP00696.1 MAG: hypothetical protein AUJ96_18370 [Armatimonadetes bacterium CG2_30_66_41]